MTYNGHSSVLRYLSVKIRHDKKVNKPDMIVKNNAEKRTYLLIALTFPFDVNLLANYCRNKLVNIKTLEFKFK